MTKERIHAAYLKQAMANHPDIHGDARVDSQGSLFFEYIRKQTSSNRVNQRIWSFCFSQTDLVQGIFTKLSKNLSLVTAMWRYKKHMTK